MSTFLRHIPTVRAFDEYRFADDFCRTEALLKTISIDDLDFELQYQLLVEGCDYDELDFIQFEGLHVCLLCFSMSSRSSLLNYSNPRCKYLSDMKRGGPDAVAILVGIQVQEEKEEGEEDGESVTREEAERVAGQIGALGYVECHPRGDCGSIVDLGRAAAKASFVQLFASKGGLVKKFFGGSPQRRKNRLHRRLFSELSVGDMVTEMASSSPRSRN